MYKILKKQTLSEQVKLMEIDAPLIAKKAKAGQFIILRVSRKRRAHTADYSRP